MDYQLIIKVPFSSIDDPAARQTADELKAALALPVDMESVQIKLQRMYKDKPPEGLKL